jgi:hypothetical protein
VNTWLSLLPASHGLCLNNQKSIAFLLKNLCPFQQGFCARLHRIAGCAVSRSGQEPFGGSFVVGNGSHWDLEFWRSIWHLGLSLSQGRCVLDWLLCVLPILLEIKRVTRRLKIRSRLQAGVHQFHAGVLELCRRLGPTPGGCSRSETRSILCAGTKVQTVPC